MYVLSSRFGIVRVSSNPKEKQQVQEITRDGLIRERGADEKNSNEDKKYCFSLFLFLCKST